MPSLEDKRDSNLDLRAKNLVEQLDGTGPNYLRSSSLQQAETSLGKLRFTHQLSDTHIQKTTIMLKRQFMEKIELGERLMFKQYLESVEAGELIIEWIEYAAFLIEVIAVLIIFVSIIVAIWNYARKSVLQPKNTEAYGELKVRLGKALLLGLEILVAADIIRTVALEATLESVIVLGLLVLIRTFLSWALVVEVEGRWPWQPEGEAGDSA